MAPRNLERETPGWEFDGHGETATAWERKLQRIRVETPDRARKTVFYTALYHSLLRRRRSTTRTPATAARTATSSAAAFQNHTVFSLWIRSGPCTADDADSGRARGRPRAVDDGHVPRADGCLSGHSGPTKPTHDRLPRRALIVDAIFKGLTTVNRGEALEAMKASALQDARGLTWLKPPRLGATSPRPETSRLEDPRVRLRRLGIAHWPRSWSVRTTAGSSRRARGSTGTSSMRRPGSCARAWPTARGRRRSRPVIRSRTARLHRRQRVAVHVVRDAHVRGLMTLMEAPGVRAQAGRVVRPAANHRGEAVRPT